MRKSEQLLNANLEKLTPKRTGSLAALGFVIGDESISENSDAESNETSDQSSATIALSPRQHETDIASSLFVEYRDKPPSDYNTNSTTQIGNLLQEKSDEYTRENSPGHEDSAGSTLNSVTLTAEDSTLLSESADERPNGGERNNSEIMLEPSEDLSYKNHSHTGSELSIEEYSNGGVLDIFEKKFGSSPNTIRYGHYIPSATFMKLEELKLDLSELTNRRITTENLFRLAQLRLPSTPEGWLALLNRHADALGVDGGEVQTRHFLGNRVDKRWPSLMSRAKLHLNKAHGIDVDRRYLFSALLEELAMTDRSILLGQLED
jgi:hypothetical protein